jgi:hypothetical protein
LFDRETLNQREILIFEDVRCLVVAILVVVVVVIGRRKIAMDRRKKDRKIPESF